MILVMSDEFLKWLAKCPVEWILNEHKEAGVATYTFIDKELIK